MAEPIQGARSRRRHAVVLSAAIFLAAAGLGHALIRQDDRLHAAVQREAASQAAAGAAFALERQLSRSLSAAYALAAVVRQHGGIEGFDALAEEMLELYGGISSLQLAPGGVVSQIHPLAGNEPALGHDLLRDPDRRFQAREAMEKRQFVLAGPFTLRQGGVGVVGRLPVFLHDPGGRKGAERFWGFTTVVVRLSDLFEAAQLGRLSEAGFDFELTRQNPESGRVERIAHDGGGPFEEALGFPVRTHGADWMLNVVPRNGWVSRPGLWLEYLVTLVAALVSSALAYLVLRQPERLRREVEARTAELARANAELAADVEKRRKAESALSLTQQVVDRALLAIAWIAEDGRIVFANEAFARLAGRSRGELLGADVSVALPALAGTDWRAAHLPGSGPGPPSRDVRAEGPGGERWLRVALDPARGTDAPLTVLYARDVTEQREAEDLLRQSQRMDAIGQLAGGVAHDFNNVLTGILASATILSESSGPGTETRELATTISAAASRAAELTRQLLGFARRSRLASAPVDVHALVREVTRLLGRTIDRSIRVVERLEAARSVVVGDAAHLQQALLNLAVNARDAMPRGGELRIETAFLHLDAHFCERNPGAAPGPHLAVSVADTGRGIPQALLGRIFEPFFTTKEAGKGTGMGLAIVYGSVRAHGGVVRVESEEGRGSRFTLYLPLPLEPVEAEGPPVPGRAPRGTGPVLVVDDDETARAAACKTLEFLGYEVASVEDGESAISWLRDRPVSTPIVLLDLDMPGMGGVACFEAIRSLRPGLRVVITSGHGHDARVQGLLDRGAAGFVAKPYGAVELATGLGGAVAS